MLRTYLGFTVVMLLSARLSVGSSLIGMNFSEAETSTTTSSEDWTNATSTTTSTTNTSITSSTTSTATITTTSTSSAIHLNLTADGDETATTTSSSATTTAGGPSSGSSSTTSSATTTPLEITLDNSSTTSNNSTTTTLGTTSTNMPLPTTTLATTLAETTTAMVTTSTASLFDTTPVTDDTWPSCPAKGCLPCPPNSVGRPHCTCLPGYTLTGQPELAGTGIILREPLPWDATNGWNASCLPVTCGSVPVLPHAQKLNQDTFVLRYNTPMLYLCDIGYFADPAVRANQNSSIDRGLDPQRAVELRCGPDGNYFTGPHCLPRCGDGRLVQTDHLPLYDTREQCDDGNVEEEDGCDPVCRVERGFVCSGGSFEQPDSCAPTVGFAEAVLMLSITGQRSPSAVEIGRAARVALAEALRVRDRDLEIMTVSTLLPDPEVNMSNATANVTRSRYHDSRVTAEATLRVKVSDPERLSLPEIRGALTTLGVMLPRVDLAFQERTSLSDLYVRSVGLHLTDAGGVVLSLGEAERQRVREEMLNWVVYLTPVAVYITFIGVIVPWLYWLVFIRLRKRRLMGNFNRIHPVFKGKSWAYNLCAWTEQKRLTCCLLFTLPARLADTWDAVGLMPYRHGVWHSLCCCLMYLFGCCLCGACVAGRQRSNLKDFFGFGDEVQGNLGLQDYCCYLCCPICCVVQEACHVDGAIVGVREAGGGSFEDFDQLSSGEKSNSRRGSIPEMPALPPA